MSDAMTQWVTIAFLLAVGSVIVIAELFLPAHGLIGLVGVGVLAYGVYEMFMISQLAGLIGLCVLAIALPTSLVISVRTWHRTPMGRRMSPANPELTDKDRMPLDELKALVGCIGRALTPLRPVGTCEFNGRRVECKAEYGMIEKGAEVEALRLVDRTVEVRSVRSSS